ncbi:MAG: BspA family leucine-rich repeat surface protein, partial [archaeon]|nr:BspA family leucine-rich repeat surface protein [archaeon]
LDDKSVHIYCKCNRDKSKSDSKISLSKFNEGITKPKENSKNIFCENKECSEPKEKISFFCKECELHLCSKCKETHPHKDRLTDLNQMKTENNLEEINKTIEDIKNKMKYEIETYKEIIEDLENIINNTKKLIQKKEEKNEELLKCFKSLGNAYNYTKDTLNYNPLNNLIINNLNDILSLGEKEFQKEIKNEFFPMINLDYFLKRKNESTLEAEYNITLKEDNHLRIFGNNFNAFNKENCKMFIDKEEVPFTKKFKEDISIGKHKIKIIMKKGKFIETMKQMFYCCCSLISVNFSEFNTSKVKNMHEAFSYCSSLISLDLSTIDTSQVEDMGSLFNDCFLLKDLNLSKFNTSKVKDMSNLFYNCYNLPSIDLSNFKTQNVNTMRYMFSLCNSLTSLDLSNFDTSKVLDMSYLFSYCSSLKYLNLFDFDTSRVFTMSNMFYKCENLLQLNLLSFNTKNVSAMNGMFEGCSSLTSLDLSNFKTNKVSTFDRMFYDCSNLSSLIFEGNEKILSAEDIIEGCDNLDEETKQKFQKKENIKNVSKPDSEIKEPEPTQE